jgi:chemotaxis protein CheC
MTVPEVLRGTGASLFEVDETSASEGLVLFLYIDFAVRKHDIRGYIAMIMDLPSLSTLKGLLDEFIARVVGEDG